MTSPEKMVRMTRLLDLYGALLTERQRQAMELYYDEDHTLEEISTQAGVTRQAVHDALRSAENALEHYEAALGLMEIRDGLERLRDEISAQAGHASRHLALIDELRNRLDKRPSP